MTVGKQRARRRPPGLVRGGDGPRLLALGVPREVLVDLSRLGVSATTVERLHESGLGWAKVRSLLRSPGVSTAKDVSSIVTLLGMDVPASDVEAWSRLGSLESAVRLQLDLVPLSMVQAFPLTREAGLTAFLRMLQKTVKAGIHVEDLLMWHTAGVLVLQPPYLVEELWAPWRAAGATRLGMQRAAMAAAAGLGVDEAVQFAEAGEFDVEALAMMAGLRTGVR